MHSITCRSILPQYQPTALRGRVGFMEDEPEWPDNLDFDLDEFEKLITQFYFADRHAFLVGHTILRMLQRHPKAVIIGQWPAGLFIHQIGKGKTIEIQAAD